MWVLFWHFSHSSTSFVRRPTSQLPSQLPSRGKGFFLLPFDDILYYDRRFIEYIDRIIVSPYIILCRYHISIGCINKRLFYVTTNVVLNFVLGYKKKKWLLKKKCFFPISFAVYFYIFFFLHVIFLRDGCSCMWLTNELYMIRVEQYSIIAGCQTNVWTQFANGEKKMLIVIPVNEIGFGNLARSSPAQWSRWLLICFLLISGFIYYLYLSNAPFYIIVWSLVSIDRMDCSQPWNTHYMCLVFKTFKIRFFIFVYRR